MTPFFSSSIEGILDGSFMKPKVTVYSDYICPFCYIGKERVDRLQQDFDLEIEWKGFEIHPETPPEGRAIEELGMDKEVLEFLKGSVERLAKEANLELKLPPMVSNSRMALEIAEYAKESDKFDEYHREVFNAYWLEGKDIGNFDVLTDIVKKAGLDLEDMNSYLKSGKAAEAIAGHLREIRALGISGVPTFLIGDQLVVGAQPYEVIKKAVEYGQMDD
jgi:predicted DsbA family dithiol-disulfide isomerase